MQTQRRSKLLHVLAWRPLRLFAPLTFAVSVVAMSASGAQAGGRARVAGTLNHSVRLRKLTIPANTTLYTTGRGRGRKLWFVNGAGDFCRLDRRVFGKALARTSLGAAKSHLDAPKKTPGRSPTEFTNLDIARVAKALELKPKSQIESTVAAICGPRDTALAGKQNQIIARRMQEPWSGVALFISDSTRRRSDAVLSDGRAMATWKLTVPRRGTSKQLLAAMGLEPIRGNTAELRVVRDANDPSRLTVNGSISRDAKGYIDRRDATVDLVTLPDGRTKIEPHRSNYKASEWMNWLR